VSTDEVGGALVGWAADSIRVHCDGWAGCGLQSFLHRFAHMLLCCVQQTGIGAQAGGGSVASAGGGSVAWAGGDSVARAGGVSLVAEEHTHAV
jgi:hypothetical protein